MPRFDRRDDVVCATNVPLLHTYRCMRANNVTHDFNKSASLDKDGVPEASGRFTGALWYAAHED